MNRFPSGSAKFSFGRTEAKRAQNSMKIGGILRRAVVALGSLALVGSIFSIYATPSNASGSAATTPTFNECPGIGHSPSCEFLIILNSDGTTTIVQDKSVGTFDGSDDTLVGVLNNSGAPVSTVGLSSSVGIFGFDGDGICSTTHSHLTYTWTPNTFQSADGSGCPYGGSGSTGYEGPTVSFSHYSSSNHYQTGEVDFAGGLANGASTFFGLEGDLSKACFTAPTTTTTTSTSTTTTSSPTTSSTVASTTSTTQASTTTTTVASTTSTVASTTSTVASTTTTQPSTPSLPPPPPPSGSTTTTAAPTTTTTVATTTSAPPISTTLPQSAPPTSPPTTGSSPSIPPATVPSGAPGTGAGGAATSTDNGVLLTASGMALFAGLAGLVLIARRRRRA